MNIALLFLVQIMYSLSDLAKRFYGSRIGFNVELLKNIPFMISLVVPFVALVLQIYVLSRYELSRTMITLGVLNIVFATALGVIVLKEKLSLINYVGVVCAVLSIILINLKK